MQNDLHVLDYIVNKMPPLKLGGVPQERQYTYVVSSPSLKMRDRTKAAYRLIFAERGPCMRNRCRIDYRERMCPVAGRFL